MVFTIGLGFYFIKYTFSLHSQKDGVSFLEKKPHLKKATNQTNKKNRQQKQQRTLF